MATLIDTENISYHLREKGIDLLNRKILVTNFSGSLQEQDLSEPTNCDGFGRVRHFKMRSSQNWPQNPLPIIPATKALKTSVSEMIRAQVFQNSICNWRCWYCFVDYKLLNGDQRFSKFLSSDDLIDLYVSQDDPPQMIDLTGGQPDLTPEWVPWMMEALMRRGLSDSVFLWSDDNLSNDFFWRYLSNEQIDLISNYKMYSRVCCFKGIDENSFSLNSKAKPELFQNQFEHFKRLMDLGIDIYAYVTLTAPTSTDVEYVIPKFLDRLQNISENLPLRTIPLEVLEFSPVKTRMTKDYIDLMHGQYSAVSIWNRELASRFSPNVRSLQISEVQL